MELIFSIYQGPSSGKVKNGAAIPSLTCMSSSHSTKLIKHTDNFNLLQFYFL
jgi:hypothetical protein